MAARIRAHDWAGTSLGPVRTWSERVKVMVEQVLASPLVASLAYGPERMLIYNDAAASLYGERHPGALGRPLADAFSDAYPAVAALYDRAYAGESLHVPAQPLDVSEAGGEVFDAYLTPVREADGRVVGAYMIGFEIGESLRAGAALSASEERYRTLFDAIDEGVTTIELIYDQDGRCVDCLYGESNPALERMTGLRDIEGRRVSEVIPNLEPAWLERYARIVRTGEPERFVDYVAGLGRWLQVFASRVGGEGSRRIVQVYTDVTERERAEAALRASEEELRYTVELNPQISWTATPDGRMDMSSERWAQWTGSHGLGEAWHEVQHPVDFPAMYERWMHSVRTGEPVDVEHRARIARDGSYRWMRSRAYPRRDAGGRIVKWYGMTEDIHESKLAVEALRESEERFSQFASSSSDGLWIRDAAGLAMEYVSPALATIYGVPPDALLGDPRRWAALIVPEDRDAALERLEQARQGGAVVHEFRIQRPSDGAFRWIRNTDFPLRDDGHVPRIGGITEDVTEARLAVEHQGVLLAELQHRVRNIMALIRSITARTAERAETVAEFEGLMMGRLLAFARVQALLTRAVNVSVGIADIVRDEIGAQAGCEGRYSVDGPDIALASRTAEVLTLAVHELTTNALKYGALSAPGGTIALRWATFERRGEPWLGFDWSEQGGHAPFDPSAPRRRGFGSELIEGRIPYELGGRGRIAIEADGVRCRLEFPLKEGASILETDAPRRAAVFGGMIDMTNQADLSGHRILVVEDDYYLATDTARAVQGAGAEVLGPCPTEAAARDEIETAAPTGAVLDINMGEGPSFALADALEARGIPFVFVTGYDARVIPPHFAGVERVLKPVDLKQIVAALAKVLGAPPTGNGGPAALRATPGR